MTSEGEKEKATLDIDMDEIREELFEEFMNTTTPTDPKYQNFLKLRYHP